MFQRLSRTTAQLPAQLISPPMPREPLPPLPPPVPPSSSPTDGLELEEEEEVRCRYCNGSINLSKQQYIKLGQLQVRGKRRTLYHVGARYFCRPLCVMAFITQASQEAGLQA